MLDSVIVARDKWLKPGGAMFPSHATIYIAPAFDHTQERRDGEFDTAIANWEDFAVATKERYGVDFSVLTEPYKNECFQYFMQNALWVDAHPAQLLGRPAEMLSFDLLTVTLDSLKAVKSGELALSVTKVRSQICMSWLFSMLACNDVRHTGCVGAHVRLSLFLSLPPLFSSLCRACYRHAFTRAISFFCRHSQLSERVPEFNSILSWFTTDFRGSPTAPLDTVVQVCVLTSFDDVPLPRDLVRSLC